MRIQKDKHGLPLYENGLKIRDREGNRYDNIDGLKNVLRTLHIEKSNISDCQIEIMENRKRPISERYDTSDLIVSILDSRKEVQWCLRELRFYWKFFPEEKKSYLIKNKKNNRR